MSTHHSSYKTSTIPGGMIETENLNIFGREKIATPTSATAESKRIVRDLKIFSRANAIRILKENSPIAVRCGILFLCDT